MMRMRNTAIKAKSENRKTDKIPMQAMVPAKRKANV
jgi:hypothetical protein